MNCQKGMNPRHHEVYLSDHAWSRWVERSRTTHLGTTARGKLARAIQARLNEVISAGIEFDSTGAGWIDMGNGLYAGVVFSLKSWVVVTITTLGEVV